MKLKADKASAVKFYGAFYVGSLILNCILNIVESEVVRNMNLNRYIDVCAVHF